MKFTDEQLLACTDMTGSAAARHLGVTRAAVSSRIRGLRAKGHSITMAKRGAILSKEDMLQAEKDNLSTAETSVLYGVHSSTVASAAKRYDVSLRRHNAPADDCIRKVVTIPRRIAEQLDERARAEKRSRSWIVSDAVRLYLNGKEK